MPPKVRKPDFPGAPRGFNTRLTVKHYGKYYVRAKEINFGLRVISNEGESAHRQAFYPVVTTGSSFRMTIEHKNIQERNHFNAWLRAYMNRVSGNADDISGYMTIETPVRDFIRTAVPRGTIDYSQDITSLVYRSELEFVGASSPIDVSGRDARRNGLSYLLLPPSKTARHFYPTGLQVKGRSLTDKNIFDADPDSREVPAVVVSPLERHLREDPRT